MKATERLEKILAGWPTHFGAISEEKASDKVNSAKWSKKEILGHLVDSAFNNCRRFVLLRKADNVALEKYEQDFWVEAQHYNERNWEELIGLWTLVNLHLLHLVRNCPRESLAHKGLFPGNDAKSLRWLIDDYIDHLEHHYKQITA